MLSTSLSLVMPNCRPMPTPTIEPPRPPPPGAKSSPKCKPLSPPPLPPKPNLIPPPLKSIQRQKPLPPPRKSIFFQKTSPPRPESNLLRKPPPPLPKGPISISMSPPKPRPKPKTKPLPRLRFDVHNGVACYTFSKIPFVGVRQWCVSKPSINLCTTCRANDDDADAML